MGTATKVLRYLAFGLTVVFGVVGGAFIIGEVFMDPGGVAAVLVSMSWVVPTIALGGFALWRPGAAGSVLGALAVLVASLVVLDTLFGIVPHDEIGPVGSIAVYAVAVVLGMLGLHRPALAGWLLLLVGAANLVGPFVMTIDYGRPPGLGGSPAAVAIPVLVIGCLFVVAAWCEPRPKRRASGWHPANGAGVAG